MKQFLILCLNDEECFYKNTGFQIDIFFQQFPSKYRLNCGTDIKTLDAPVCLAIIDDE